MNTRIEPLRAGLAILTTLGLVIAMMMVFSGPADASHEAPDDSVEQDAGGTTNQPAYWVTYLQTERNITGATCSKLTETSSSSAWVMPSPPEGKVWVLLVVKQATRNFVYYDPVAGHTYPSTGDQAPGFSHIIACHVPAPTTTTTVAEETTTTVAEETTTTVGIVEDTTTTTIEDEVLGTVITTSTTAPAVQVTTTVVDEVLDTDVEAEELPFTGIDTDQLVGMAVLLLAGGLIMLAVTGRREES